MVFIRPASRPVPSNRSLSTTYLLVSTLNRHGTNVLDFAYHPGAVRQCVSRVSSYHRVWEPLMNLARTIASMILTSGFLVLSSAAAAQNSADNRPAASSAAQDPSVARLEKDIPELMKQGTVPGLSIALVRDGRTYWLHNFGVKETKTREPVTEDTIFEAASLSKPVFAYAVLKLVEQGKLGLDMPLTTYLPKPYIEGDDRLAKITIRIVLSHRTGFPNWRGDGNALTIHFTPGERFSYSGEGFVYLQKVVEQVTGKPLNDFMAETVFAPLGMTSSSYVWRTDYDERTATGHDADGQPKPLWKPQQAIAASSLNTTVKDYARFVEAVLNGTGLTPATVREMETPQIAVDPECTNCTERASKGLSKSLFWGLGWGVQRTEQGDSLWHWGDNGSFKCFVMTIPKDKRGVMIFTNSENGLAIAKEVVHDAMGGEQPAFSWIRYDSYDSVAMRFGRAVREEGATEAIRQFAGFLKGGAVSEGSINSVGYRLLWRKQTADAIRIFQLNVELHPESSNAYDSLGDAYMEVGDKQPAAKNYEKSLELDPKNTNAVERLKKLKAN